jgi:hypothetical protein
MLRVFSYKFFAFDRVGNRPLVFAASMPRLFQGTQGLVFYHYVIGICFQLGQIEIPQRIRTKIVTIAPTQRKFRIAMERPKTGSFFALENPSDDGGKDGKRRLVRFLDAKAFYCDSRQRGTAVGSRH